MPAKVSCGIDFGTSNSTCAISDGAGVRLIALERESSTLPSAIFLHQNGTSLFGREAIAAYIDGEDGRLMRGLKSVLGTALMDEKTTVNNRARSFAEILAIFIRHIKNEAEKATGHKIEDVIMGRPVHFHDNNPDADRRSQEFLEKIATMVGFKNIQFQYEPIAAAFSHERDLSGEKLSLVIDIGGGTSDFTVIRLSEKRGHDQNRNDDILSTSGIRVGGTNFDYRTSMKLFMPHLGSNSSYRSDFDEEKILDMPLTVYANLSDWAKVNHAQTSQAVNDTKKILRQSLDPEKIERLLRVQEEKLGHAFLQKVESTKIALTDNETTETGFDDLEMDFSISLTRKKLEQTIAEYIKKISASINDCLKQAGVKKDQIELIILTGGSTELPVIKKLVQDNFPHAEISQGNKFGSVGLGLAYQAQSTFGKM